MRKESRWCFRMGVSAVCVLMLANGPSMLFSQAPVDTGQPIPVMSANQLDGLVAPIALYPDPLLSQILVAATYPLELVAAHQWLERNSGLSGPALTQAAQAQNWDPSIQALVMFPDVMQRLTDDINWTTDLGNAFLDQQGDVMNAVQRMRFSAQQAGKLASSPQQQVLTTTQGGQPVVVITPANPEVIYVPAYDPAWVWGSDIYYPYPRWYYPRRSGFFFGAGISIGSFLGVGWGGWGGWGWQPGWGNRSVIVNNSFVRRYNFNSVHLANRSGRSGWSRDTSWGRDTSRRQVASQQAPSQSRTFGPNRQSAGPSRQSAPLSLLPRNAQSQSIRTTTPGQSFRTAPTPSQSFRATPMERTARPQVVPDSPSRSRNAFTGGENRNSARLQSDQGNSTVRSGRSAAPMARSAAPSSSSSSSRRSESASRSKGEQHRGNGRDR